MVARNGGWKALGRNEAHAALMGWMLSRSANVNRMAVKRFISFKDGEFVNSDPGMVRLLHGLGMGFFRHRLAGGPFHWGEDTRERSASELQAIEEIARAVLG